MGFLLEMLKYAIGPAAIVAAVAWFSQLLVGRAIDRDMEKYKSELDRDVEKYRSELETSRIESQTKYSLFKHKQAEVLGVVYGGLVKSCRHIDSLVRRLQSANNTPLLDRKKKTAETINSARHYFEEHQIYLDEDLSQQINKMLTLMSDAFNKFSAAQPGPNYAQDDTGGWQDAYDIVKGNLPPLLKEMHSYIRSLIDERSQD